MLTVSNRKKKRTKQTPYIKKSHSNINTYSMTVQVMAQPLREVTYFNHRQTALHKDVFMIFKLESNYVTQVYM